MHPSLVPQAANYVKRSVRARSPKRQEEEKKDRPRKHTVLNENSAGVDASSESGTLRRGASNSAFALIRGCGNCGASAVPTIWNQPELRIRSGLGGNFVAPPAWAGWNGTSCRRKLLSTRCAAAQRRSNSLRAGGDKCGRRRARRSGLSRGGYSREAERPA